ncbi:hypothetical protein [Tautonia marina]|uniref:hypothetical protein n=1 Tax=Tautonia marina TaxID=2653855 RepID=UPI0012604B7F|nr:hypothetical protein [Tautonia marina]
MRSRLRLGGISVVVLALVTFWPVAVQAAEDQPGPVALVERLNPGDRLRVRASLEAEGRYLPGEATEDTPVAPIELTVSTRIESVDQVLAVDTEGQPTRLWRQAEQASVAIGGPEPIRPQTITLRPEVSSLIVERPTEPDGRVVVASPQGPLTRAELDLVQMPADPIDVLALLPEDGAEVAPGARWAVPDGVARSISGYDALASNTVEATLRSVDEESAEVDLAGSIAGAVLGGEGEMTITGSLRFDRRAGRIALVTIERDERRKPGPVEAGLEFRSTIRIERSKAADEASETPAPKVPDRLPDDWLLLTYSAPDGRYTLQHDRAWHVFSEDEQQVVLRRVEAGTVVVQANLVAGPTVEPGAQPKAERFRDDVKKALGDRFDRMIDAGAVAAPEGEFRYRLALAGRQGEEPIVWYYYLVSDSKGRQVVAIFTLRASQVERFGRRDQRMIGSLRWLPEVR